MLRALAGYSFLIAGAMVAVTAIAFEPWSSPATYVLVIIALALVGAGYFAVMWEEMK